MGLARSMAEFSEAYPKTYGQHVTQVPAPNKVTTFTAGKLKNYLESEGIEIADLDMDKMVSVFQQDFKGKGNVVPRVGKDGVRRFYEIDMDLYNALQGVDPLISSELMKWPAYFARWIRTGATGVNLTFGWMRNPARDVAGFAVYNTYTKNPFKIIGDPLKGMYKGLAAKKGDLAWRFKAVGGELTAPTGFDRDLAFMAFDEMLLLSGGLAGKTLHVVKNPVDALRAIINIPELGPRVAELEGSYAKLKKEHPDWSEEKLFITTFNNAADVTLNFLRSGRIGKKLNEAYPFFNANIQGPNKTYREVKANPLAFTAKGFAFLTSTAMAAWWKVKDEEWWQNLSPAYKYGSTWIKTPTAIFRIPIPFELGSVFMALPVAIADYNYHKDPGAFRGFGDLVKGQMPGVLPGIIGPAWDIQGNKDWLSRPIESERLRQYPIEDRKKEDTTMMAIELSRAFRVFGIQISPIQMEYALSAYTGGLYRRVSSTFDPIREPADIPVIGGAILRAPEKPRRQIEQFYKDLTKLKELKNVGKATHRQEWQLKRMTESLDDIKVRFERIKKSQKAGDMEARDKEFIRLKKRLERVKKTVKKI